jgi:hypothetical protein
LLLFLRMTIYLHFYSNSFFLELMKTHPKFKKGVLEECSLADCGDVILRLVPYLPNDYFFKWNGDRGGLVLTWNK